MAQAQKLKQVAISEIIVGERFRIDYGNLDELADSITSVGLIQPITLDSEFNLLAGGRRLAAHKQIGADKISAIVREVTDELDLREIELVENIHRKDFTWSERAACTARVHELCKSLGRPSSIRSIAAVVGDEKSTVYQDLQLAEAIKILPDLAKTKTRDEAVKILAKMHENAIVEEQRTRQQTQTMSRGLADMLKIADANYRIGDSLLELAALPSNMHAANIIEVDPPYGINLKDVKRQADGVNLVNTYNEIDEAAYPDFLAAVAKECYRFAAPHAWMIWWFGPTHHNSVLMALRHAGWHVDDIPAIWSKTTGQTMQPEIYLARTYEPFFVCRKGSPVLSKRGTANVFNYMPSTKKYHPTERPIDLMEKLLDVFGGPGQGVVVPFLGSGVTLRAAYKCGMKGMGYDISGEYKDRFMLAVESDTNNLNKE